MKDAASSEETLVPLWEETVGLDNRKVVTGRGHVSTRVEEHDETVRTELARDQVDVVRAPIDIEFDAPPKMRRESPTLIIPVVEERLVLVKRYLLEEEVHVTATSKVEAVEEVVRLRSMHSDVRRSASETDPQS